MNTSFQETDNYITFSNLTLDVLWYLEGMTCQCDLLPQSDAMDADSITSPLKLTKIDLGFSQTLPDDIASTEPLQNEKHENENN